MKKIIKHISVIYSGIVRFILDLIEFQKFHSKNELEFIKRTSFNFYNFYFNFFIKKLNHYLLLFHIFFIIVILVLAICYINDCILSIIVYISLNNIIIVTVLIFYICLLCLFHQTVLFVIRLLYLFNFLYTTRNLKSLSMLLVLYCIRIFIKFFFSFHFLVFILYPLGLDMCYVFLSIVPLFKWIYFDFYVYWNGLTFSMLRWPSFHRFIFDPLTFHLSGFIKKLQYYTLDFEVKLFDKHRRNLWGRIKF